MARAIDHRHLEAALPAHAIGGANAAQEREGGVVTPHQDVLAVVDPLAGCWIRKSGGAATEPGPGFDDEHARA